MYMHAGPNGNQTGPHCSSVSTNVVVPNLIRLVQLLHAAKFTNSKHTWKLREMIEMKKIPTPIEVLKI